MFLWNQQEQSDAADDGKSRTVIEYGRMADPIPQQSGNDARYQLQQADGGAVPADAAGAQMLRHKIRCERFADSAEYPLIQSVKDKQCGDQNDVLRQCKAEIGDQKDDKRRKQDIFSTPLVGKRPCRIGNQRGYQIERRIDQDIVVSKEAPISCVRRIRNELVEFPSPNNAVTNRYFQ